MTRQPRWVAPATSLLAASGVAGSAYLTWVHFREPRSLSCPDTGVVNCVKVTTSPQSYLVGIPVAVLGLAFFVAMLALCLPWAWRATNPWLSRARIAGAVAGVGFALYLVAVELLVVRAICLWCTAVHVVALGLFATVLAAEFRIGDSEPPDRPSTHHRTSGVADNRPDRASFSSRDARVPARREEERCRPTSTPAPSAARSWRSSRSSRTSH